MDLGALQSLLAVLTAAGVREYQTSELSLKLGPPPPEDVDVQPEFDPVKKLEEMYRKGMPGS